jgi:hypothetical protein
MHTVESYISIKIFSRVVDEAATRFPRRIELLMPTPQLYHQAESGCFGGIVTTRSIASVR